MNKPNNIKLPDKLTKNGFYPSNKEKNQIDKDKLEYIIRFIKLYFYRTKYINKKQSSYGLKHLVARDIGVNVSNGDLIASMIICGYKHKRDGINCCFNVNTDNVK